MPDREVSPLEEVTLGELGRRLDVLSMDLRDMRHALVEHDDLRVAKEALSASLQAHEALAFARMDRSEYRIGALEATQTWLVRGIIAVVLLAVLALVLVDPLGTPLGG